MKVVFDDDDAAPPAAAASESTSRTRLIPGQLPFVVEQPRLAADARSTVPIVSKKSDSMTARTTAIAVQNPSADRSRTRSSRPGRSPALATTLRGDRRDARRRQIASVPDLVDDRSRARSWPRSRSAERPRDLAGDERRR